MQRSSAPQDSATESTPEVAPAARTSPRRALGVVVLIEAYLPVLGGAQNNVQELCRRLSERGFHCEVLTRRYASHHPPLETLDGVTVRRFGLCRVRPLAKLLWAARALTFLLRHRERYELVLSVPIFYWADLLPAYLNRLLSGKPFCVRTTMAGNFSAMLSWSTNRATGALKKALFPPILWRRVLAAASAIIAQSELMLERARSYGLEAAQLIPNGVDTERFAVAGPEQKRKLRRRLSLPEDCVIVVCTGRFVVEKNQIALLGALRRIIGGREQPRVLLLLLGIEEFNQASATEESLRGFVQAHGLEDRVRFLRDVEAVEHYLGAADIFVLPTMFDEGVSNSVLEAMSCGLPVVCSDLPQLRGMFPPDAGLFFRPDDITGLSAHLQHLLGLPDLGQARGRALAAHVRETQPIDRTIDAYESLFRRLPRQ